MTFWLLIAMLGLAVLVALWRLARLDRTTLQLVASALLLALAGYAWQGSPGQAGSPRRGVEARAGGDGGIAELRRQMMGRFDAADRWLIIADSRQQRGDTRGAADAAAAGAHRRPDNGTLWVGLGNALVAHAGGLLTPASELAYRRALQSWPDHPGPKFFYGLALAQNGRFDAAERLWVQALAAAPADATWRPEVEGQLQLLRQTKAMSAPGR